MSQPNNQKPPTNSMKKQYKMKNRYARVVRFGDIRHKLPPKFNISPVSMILHESKAYRYILDLSFQIGLKQKPFESVNTHTNKQAKA